MNNILFANTHDCLSNSTCLQIKTYNPIWSKLLFWQQILTYLFFQMVPFGTTAHTFQSFGTFLFFAVFILIIFIYMDASDEAGWPSQRQLTLNIILRIILLPYIVRCGACFGRSAILNGRPLNCD